MGAKILEIGPYPPPQAGWATRIEQVVKELRRRGHICIPLNTGLNRRVKSPNYEDVQNGWDYVLKVYRYCRQGFILHTHANGDSPKGLFITLFTQCIAMVLGKRPVLTFHAGVEQIYFPLSNSGKLAPLFRLLFAIPQKIICNNDSVKAKIIEYGIPSHKVTPIPGFTQQYLQHETVPLDPKLESFFMGHSPVIFSYIKFREGFYIDTLIEGFRILQSKLAYLGLLLVGTSPEDSTVETKFRRLITEFDLQFHIYEAPHMSHDAFLTAMKQCALYLRTPTTDGVCSSILEALSLNIPVVAADNGARPKGVITYQADDSKDMATKVTYVLENLEAVRAQIVPPPTRDTLQEEVQLLINCYQA